MDIKADGQGELVINLSAVFFLGAAWERKITGSGDGIEYIEADSHVDLQDPTHQFCFAMGYLAQGERECADQWVEDLRTSAPDLARRLEAALEYADREASETHPIPADTLGEVPSETDTQLADFAGLDRPFERERTKPARKSEPRKEIRLNVGGTEIVARHNPDLYFQVLKMLVEGGVLDRLELPVSSGRKRNLLSRTPIHKDGSRFLAPVEYGGYYMESHSSRESGMRILREFLESLGIESSVVAKESSANEAVVASPVSGHRERVLGSLLGLAVCDALGTTAEFKPGGTFPEITSMIGGGPFGLQPGEWTDDTSMALCLAESSIESRGFDPVDQMERYVRWWREGHLSSTGRCFDIGMTVRDALLKFERTGNPYSGSSDPRAAGNGSLMRLAPVPLFYRDDARKAIHYSKLSSATTHAAKEATDACRYFASLILGALEGRSKEELLSPMFSIIPGLWGDEPLEPKIAAIAEGDFKSADRVAVTGTGGYVVTSLHIALWAFHHTDNFRDGALKAVNVGYDADTYGAIYGQLAGAYYGASGIPAEWHEILAGRDLIESFATKLYELRPKAE